MTSQRRVAIGVAVLGTLFTLAGCTRDAPPNPEPTPAPISQRPATQPLPPLGASLYELGALALDDQDRARVGLDVYRGHPVVVSMFYTSCPNACPALLSRLKRLERRLDDDTRARTRFLLVSLDPDRDTPPRLNEVLRQDGLDPARWKLARASESDVRLLAAALGIKYRKLASGQFSHSTLITVLDASGRSVARAESLESADDELVSALSLVRALAPESAPKPSAALGEPRGARNQGLVKVPAGIYRPLYAPSETEREQRVASFYLDRFPVTNGRYFEFVGAHPEWRRDRVSRVVADGGYLGHWSGPDQLGAGARSSQPVVNVSWFAAKAYCEADGGRLASEAEWELAAAAPDAATRQRILAWYGRPAAAPLADVGKTPANRLGIYDLHGLIWEWVLDFNSTLVSSDSRSGRETDKLPFCGAGAFRADKADDYAAFMRNAFRSSLRADYTASALGFRCAHDRARER